MADAATVVMKTTILPDEIAKTIEATTTVTPLTRMTSGTISSLLSLTLVQI